MEWGCSVMLPEIIPVTPCKVNSYEAEKYKSKIAWPCLSCLTVHKFAVRGTNIAFNCSFNLGNEKLYSVKWYRGTYEIFRYVPSDTPPTKTFPLEGFSISESPQWASLGNTLHLLNVSFCNSGDYSCEVTTEGSFHTLIAQGGNG